WPNTTTSSLFLARNSAALRPPGPSPITITSGMGPPARSIARPPRPASTSRKDALDRPDTLVFDLDPPDGRFDMARAAAHLLRELFDQLGLPVYVKTTGSKGLHVVAPLDDEATFDE